MSKRAMTKAISMLACLAAMLALVRPDPARGAGTAFTYQGQLKSGGSPVNGNCDLQFMLFESLAAVTPIGTQIKTDIPVANGLFTVQLDFGAAAFPGADRWLEIGARCPAGAGAFTSLPPRQPVTTVPYAIRAMNANVLDAPGGGPANALFVNNTGRVGVGTTAPATELDVRGNLTLDAGGNPVLNTSSSSVEQNRYLLLVNSPSFTSASGLKAGGILVADGYDFFDPGKNHLVVKGSVGIGTGVDDSSSKLSIFGQDALEISGYQPYLRMSDANEQIGAFRPTQYRLHTASGHFVLQRSPLCVIPPCPEFAEIMHVAPTGNVGFGTITPQSRLHVAGTTLTRVLQINGGADFSENFDVNAIAEGRKAERMKVEAGMVVSIDPANAGKLAVSTRAYDRRVAGIISGAGGVEPGMVMGQEGTLADGKHPVALSGRVYCWVDASYGAIVPGDLLTTSDTPGHAMRVADHARAQGATLGKAMTGLGRGEKGLVLTLVSLQ